MKKAKDLLQAVEAYSRMKDLAVSKAFADPEAVMRELPDDKFRLLAIGVADTFRTLKHEAIRRGIWDELKGKKAGQ